MNTQVGDGLFVLRGKIVQYLDKLERLTYRMGEMFDSERIWTPSHLSVDNTKKTGYTDSFSNQASLIHSIDGHELGMCSPTVCYHCYSMLSDTHHTENKSYMMTGKCTRIEDEGDSLERLFNFTISEIVFVGDKDYCEESLSDVIIYVEQILNQLGIKYHFECASDPFFGDKSELKEKVQLMGGSKIEIMAEVPNENRTIAIGSFNFHGKKFVKSFDIYDASTTACFGWGLERFVHILMLQKGDDFDLNSIKFTRPDKFRKDIRLNLTHNQEGWIRSGVDTHWICEKELIDIPLIEDDTFVVIDSVDKILQYESQIQSGIKDMEENLHDWKERWDWDELVRRVESGGIFYCNIIDDKFVQCQFYWFSKFTIKDHGWNLELILPKEYAYSGHWWCHPKYRYKRGLLKNFFKLQWNDLKNRGIQTDVSYVDGWNRKARTSCVKIGYVCSNWLLNFIDTSEGNE
jgi:hypothetical protein